MHSLITTRHIEDYQRDGVVLIKGLFAEYIDLVRDGIEANMQSPGPYAAENLKPGESGRFFDDYCNWQRISQFRDVIHLSPAAEVAADLMESQTVQIFHDHVLVKEPGTSKPTPWHQDSPYYFVEGRQTVSFWSPVDPVSDASLRCVARAVSAAPRSDARNARCCLFARPRNVLAPMRAAANLHRDEGRRPR